MKTYKIEVKLTPSQKKLFFDTQCVCKFVYNEMVAYNSLQYDLYKQGVIATKPKFMNAFAFSKFLNNELIPIHNWTWIKDVSSKSVKQSLINCEKAFKRFFTNTGKYPKFKNYRSNIGVYLPKNNKTEFTKIQRNKIKIPVFGWIHLKEFGRLHKSMNISSCTITRIADRYYISFLVKEPTTVPVKYKLTDDVVGIDLGLEKFATFSNGIVYASPNKDIKINKLRRKLKRERRKYSRKKEQNKYKETSHRNENKQLIKVQRLYAQISRSLKGYHNHIIDALVGAKPKAIVIEDLNIRGMMKNKHLSKNIQNSGFYQFRELLEYKANKYGIDILVVDRFFPSSKLCCSCGNKKTNLKLSDRIFECQCGFKLDRDHNAALNLMLQYK